MSEYQQLAPGDLDRVDRTDKILVFPIDVYLGISAGMEPVSEINAKVNKIKCSIGYLFRMRL